MPGGKTAGWAHFQAAVETLVDAHNQNNNSTSPDFNMLAGLATGVKVFAFGTDRSFQELYERIERLHQKIDRMEKKIGSVPGAK